MATVFTSKISLMSRLLTGVLVTMWLILLGFVGFRYWLFWGDDMGLPNPAHVMVFDDIFFVVTGVMMIMIGIIGYTLSTLYNSLNEAVESLEQEHEATRREEQEKIRIKRQLTNNINHELKTPICSILGYLEMVLSNGELEGKVSQSFVQKSYDQAERLRRLMLDLSTITRIDEGAAMVERTRVDLREVITSVIEDTLPQAEQQSIHVISAIRESLVVNGNQTLLYSVFRNLVDNAVAYSGGRTVNIIHKGSTESHYRFIIQDNGIGVETKHLPHLFERFYRVDKGRSRKAGGTGLGLSIVKNAVVFHGGTIVARTAASGGLEFDFTIKRNEVAK